MKIKTLCALLGASLLYPGMAQADIVQRQVLASMASEPDSEGGDVFTIAGTTACGGKQIRMDARSVNLDEAPYDALKAQLAERMRARTPMLVTLKKCPEDASVPIVRQISACMPATCADGRARLYLHERFFPIEQEKAPNVLLLPLPKGKQPGTWKVDIYSVADHKLRLSGQVNRADYAQGELVGGYVTYYPNGKVEKQVAQDGQGRQHGIGSKYFPDGTLELRGDWRHGMPEGEHQRYHATGKLSETSIYRDGKQLDGPVQTFDENGKLSSSYTLRGGKMEGEMLTYFPDGKISSRSEMHDGKSNGVTTHYYPDGAVHARMTQVDDLPVGEALEFYPDGKVQSRQRYGDKGGLLSLQRYSPQGVLVLERRWDAQWREQGTSRSWYENGKPEQSIEYVNDRRDGWSRSWHEDGSLKSECQYVAGKAQGGCGEAPPAPELQRKEQAWRAL
ncbi:MULTISPECIES: toxin-antitoxin system YwqK family antitoxin [unclassified Janthinobacterium]|uniref:toxin-antitoxin system YwqK family antitoxin n=1 Tax=unclassified Janthinobacterium TaxID=2610881 RepID=UPI001E283728|nr:MULTISPECIES: toxin-antitoxin system YwqK family antitoxin [unclassified Janthinobacterium]MCC7641810.1 toxin-antitoxin system YwqK family antitoxin [Janthinobacterium sp. EB271-G4-3-1]MCC7689936.1 toxin-antitoxin system YwqK family antitoxin [Janthinobacterium sp. EB271-G4-3-2]